MFCPELQKLLKPIYVLTRKGRHFIWGKEQLEAYEKIKRRLVKAPVLHMPNCEGRFHLYSDLNKFAVGSALYQIQNGKLKLKAYASKRLPKAVCQSTIDYPLCRCWTVKCSDSMATNCIWPYKGHAQLSTRQASPQCI